MLLATGYLCLTARGSSFKHNAGPRVTLDVCLHREDLIDRFGAIPVHKAHEV